MTQDNVIVYNFAQLEGLSVRIGAVSDALENVRGIFEKTAAGTDEYWQGQAHDAFASRMEEMNVSLSKLYEQVSVCREKLDKAIELEKQNETDITQKTVGELSADDIF